MNHEKQHFVPQHRFEKQQPRCLTFGFERNRQGRSEFSGPRFGVEEGLDFRSAEEAGQYHQHRSDQLWMTVTMVFMDGR